MSCTHRHHGRDIDGACGQLAVKVVKSSSTGDSCKGGGAGGDIEDLVTGNNGRTGGVSGRGNGRRGNGRRKSAAGAAAVSSGGDTVDIIVGEGGVSMNGEGAWARKRVAAAVLVVGLGAIIAAGFARSRRRGT